MKKLFFLWIFLFFSYAIFANNNEKSALGIEISPSSSFPIGINFKFDPGFSLSHFIQSIEDTLKEIIQEFFNEPSYDTIESSNNGTEPRK